MIQTKTRLCITVEHHQAKTIRKISGILGIPVSELIRDLIGESVQNFEHLVFNPDPKLAQERLNQLTAEAQSVIDMVKSNESN